VNDLTDAKTLSHLLTYDSIHGKIQAEIQVQSNQLVVNGQAMEVLAKRDPKELPWKSLGVDLVIESTGRFTDREGASQHLSAGAPRVVISAPGKDADLTVVLGVNETTYNPEAHRVISNASCTTNCLATVSKVLLENFGIHHGYMTTIHSYTNDQHLLDLPHKDLRRARSAALSMIPTSTGAAKALHLVIPELKGKMDGLAIRVPTPNVSLIDLSVEVEQSCNATQVNEAFAKAADGPLKGILGYSEAPIVSIDLNGSAFSATVDSPLTTVLQDRFVKVFAWYDNEWGYSCRLRDVVKFLAAKG
jgi:glyceraldehyde 3-phosphate dehydrogenase